MTEKSVTDAQKRATQAYRERNREKTRYQSARSAARSFINNRATIEDLNDLKELIECREKELNEA